MASETSVCFTYTPYQIQTRSAARGTLTSAEKMSIANALGLGAGHWYNCPNGHLYCVGECGGPVITSKCPECGADIGGMGTALPGNNKDNSMARYYIASRKVKSVGAAN